MSKPRDRGSYLENGCYIPPASPFWSAKRYKQITGHEYKVPEDAKASERPWRLP